MPVASCTTRQKFSDGTFYSLLYCPILYILHVSTFAHLDELVLRV
jgi:hypothetical protein